MKVEGIIIHKTFYKERDIITKLLLRSGKVMNLYFYGGRGGGKSQKGSFIELGNMLSCELNSRKKKLETDIKIVKESKLIWNSENIRLNYNAFCLVSFYLELTSKLAVEEFEDDLYSEHEGLFNILSNALFFLDKSIANNDFHIYNHLFIFLGKIIVHQGIMVDTTNCLFCQKDMKQNELCLFDAKNGGFVCHDCASNKDHFLSDNQLLREEYQNSVKLRGSLSFVYRLPYKEYFKLPEITRGLTAAEFNYINYQYGFMQESFKTWSLLQKI